MIVKHTFAVQAICPVNGDMDTYECVVTVGQLVQCEQLVEDVAAYRKRSIYQENLTQELAQKWQATVTTKGWHVGGTVATTCTAFPQTRVTINDTGEHA